MTCKVKKNRLNLVVTITYEATVNGRKAVVEYRVSMTCLNRHRRKEAILSDSQDCLVLKSLAVP